MTLRGIRRRNLKKQGFFGFERQALTGVTFKRSPWLKLVRKDRAREFEDMKALSKARNWSPTRFWKEWGSYIGQKYIDNNWLRADKETKKMMPDAWVMFRAERADAIRSGRWVETPEYRGKRRTAKKDDGGYKRIDKGDVKAQKARARERAIAKRG